MIIVGTGRWIRQINDPTITFLTKQPARHRRSRADLRRIKQPTESPIRFQAFTSQQEIRGNRFRIMSQLACYVALQARCTRGEHLASGQFLLFSQWLQRFLNIWVLLPRHSHEEPYERLQFVWREIERRHPEV